MRYVELFEAKFETLPVGGEGGNEETTIWSDPTKREFVSFIKNSGIIRGVIDESSGIVYGWDAYQAPHSNMTDALGIEQGFIFIAAASLSLLKEENDWGKRCPIFKCNGIFFMITKFEEARKNPGVLRVLPTFEYVEDNN